MTEYFHDIDERREFFDSFHSNIMDHGLWMCKNLADLSNDVIKEVLCVYNLPYDVFRLQRTYIVFYTKIVDIFRTKFLFEVFSALRKGEVREEKDVVSIIKKKMKDSNFSARLTDDLANLLNKFLVSYLYQYFNIITNRDNINKHLAVFAKQASAEIEMYINVSIDFFRQNASLVIEYLNEQHEKHTEIDDPFGRCIFALMEETYDVKVFFDGEKEVQYFYREFCNPLIKVFREEILGEKAYDEINKKLKGFIQTLLKEGMAITKFSFEIFFPDEFFRRYLCNHLIVLLRKMNDLEISGQVIKTVNESLAAEGSRFMDFKPQHYYIIVDCWSDFIAQYNPDLLVETSEPLAQDDGPME